MKSIMLRHCEDDFSVLMTAEAMEMAGCDVFSVTPNGTHRRFGAMIDCTKFIVWAKYPEEKGEEFPYEVDKAIEAALNKK